MKLSSRADYGTRALLDIALHQGEGPLLLRDIAQRQEISPLYLGHLITPLVSRGIVGTTRGARGGFWLAKPPQEIKLSEVVQALEGSMALVECSDNPKHCSRFDVCVTRQLWDEVTTAMYQVLESTTLQDLVDRYREKERLGEVMYYI